MGGDFLSRFNHSFGEKKKRKIHIKCVQQPKEIFVAEIPSEFLF